MFMLNANEPIKVAHLEKWKISQSINVEWHTCDRDGKQFFQWKQEKLWSFEKARNVLIKKQKNKKQKKKKMSSEKYISTRFR